MIRETVELYIGPCPSNGELEVEKIKDILDSQHDRFVIKGIFDGYWKGYQEDTYVVLISDLPETISETIGKLEHELDGATIAIVTSQDLELM